MRKKVIIIIFFVIIIIALFSIIFLNSSKDYSKVLTPIEYDNLLDEYSIKDEQTALKYGKALLEDYFVSYYSKNKCVVRAEETENTWIIYDDSMIPNFRKKMEKYYPGKKITGTGGGYRVEFKKNGEIIKIGVID